MYIVTPSSTKERRKRKRLLPKLLALCALMTPFKIHGNKTTQQRRQQRALLCLTLLLKPPQERDTSFIDRLLPYEIFNIHKGNDVFQQFAQHE